MRRGRRRRRCAAGATAAVAAPRADTHAASAGSRDRANPRRRARLLLPRPADRAADDGADDHREHHSNDNDPLLRAVEGPLRGGGVGRERGGAAVPVPVRLEVLPRVRRGRRGRDWFFVQNVGVVPVLYESQKMGLISFIRTI